MTAGICLFQPVERGDVWAKPCGRLTDVGAVKGDYRLTDVGAVKGDYRSLKDVLKSRANVSLVNLMSLIRSPVRSSQRSFHSSSAEEQASDSELLALGASARTFAAKQEGKT